MVNNSKRSTFVLKLKKQSSKSSKLKIMTTNSSKSEKVFFLTKSEYNGIKEVVNLKNFTRVPGANKEIGGFSFYEKKEKVL